MLNWQWFLNIDFHGRQFVATTTESTHADGCYRTWNRYFAQFATERERTQSNGFYTIREGDRCQTCAIGESSVAKFLQTAWENDLLQSTATIKRIFVDSSNVLGNGYGGKAGAFLECLYAYQCDGVGNNNFFQSAAPREHIVADGCQTIGNDDRSETGAVLESINANGCHGVGNDDGFKTTTFTERIHTYACDAVRNLIRCQIVTTIKGIVAQRCHSAGEGYRLQVTTILECPMTDCSHCVGCTFIGDCFGDYNIA